MTSTLAQETSGNPLRRDLPPATIPRPCCVVLFGATGDLTRRKLIPALYNLARDGFLPPGFTVLGVARRAFSDEQFREDLRKEVSEHSRSGAVSPEVWKDFAAGMFYQALQLDRAEDYVGLAARIREIEATRLTGGKRLYYLATDPAFFAPAAEHLRAAGLVNGPTDPAWTRLVVEKPIGRDLSSAGELNARLQAAFAESQIFRIDHYLGKETVQNILALRFANAIFEPLWNRRYIHHVQIAVAERVGMEGRRGQYYDTAGATRDMVQNHMMQLLSLVAMEPPVAMDGQAIRDEKVKVLRAIQPIAPNGASHAERPAGAPAAAGTAQGAPLGVAGTAHPAGSAPGSQHSALLPDFVRGQYGPGSFAGQAIKGYRQEEGVDPNSMADTYLALRLFIDTWRWSGVPFYLRTGKRLPKRLTEIAIQFRQPPMAMFRHMEQMPAGRNQLVLRVQPDEGVSLSFDAKVPGMRMRLEQVKMDFRYGSSFGGASPEAYERLLLDAMLGDSTLFIRADEVEYSWRLISPMLEYWASPDSPRPTFPNYEAGTWGPPEAARLFDGTGAQWRRL